MTNNEELKGQGDVSRELLTRTQKVMKSRICGGLNALGIALGMGLLVSSATAAVDLVSTTKEGMAQATGGGSSTTPILSANGRFVLFASTAEDLVVGNDADVAGNLPHSVLNVFLRDRTNGTTVLVSVNAAGAGGGNADSLPTGVSADGRYAVFQSSASNLVADDTNNVSDIYVRDLVSNQTILVSVSTNGNCASGPSKQPVMTPDGRYVAFTSVAADLVPGDTNGIADVFVRDLESGVTTLASPGATLSSSTSGSDAPIITPDGRYVGFLSTAVGLVQGVTTVGEVYVRDMVAGIIYAVSTNSHGLFPAATSVLSYSPAISSDGQYVSYVAGPTPSGGTNAVLRFNLLTGAADIVSLAGFGVTSGQKHFRELDMTPDGRFVAYLGKSGGTVQVFVWDAQDGSTTLVSCDLSNGPPAYGLCDSPVITADGSKVAFLSSAANMVSNPVEEGAHLYVRDLQKGTTRLVDAGTNGAASANDILSAPALNADGTLIAFDCTGPNLVANDANAAYDVFVRDLLSDQVEAVSVRATSLPSRTVAGVTFGPTLSASGNGAFLAFSASPGGRVSGSTNVYRQVFVRDVLNRTTLTVSLSTNGVWEADGASTDPTISADGRVVAFSSAGDNLLPRDSNNRPDVFVRDLVAGTNGLVSVAMDGASFPNGPSSSPVLSADGRYVMFRSRASNLAPGTFSTVNDSLFWRDLQARTNCVVNRTGISCAAMTRDGRFVAFGGVSGNLYIWDWQLGQVVSSATTVPLTYVAISGDGKRAAGAKGSQIYYVDQALGTNFILVPSTQLTALGHGTLQFSADGRYLVYVTAEPVFVADQNGVADVYLYDAQTQSHKLISRSFDSTGAANALSDAPVLSPDGRFVAYRSAAGNLVPGASNNVTALFLYDQQVDATVLLSVSKTGDASANNVSMSPVFSGDSGTVFFQSWASDVVPGDFNQGPDLFALKLTSSGELLVGEIVYAPGPGQNPKLTWTAVAGKTYKVQYKDQLTDAAWQDLPVEVKIVNNKGVAEDTTPRGATRFYRVSQDSN